jgi:hypothetical protein
MTQIGWPRFNSTFREPSHHLDFCFTRGLDRQPRLLLTRTINLKTAKVTEDGGQRRLARCSPILELTDANSAKPRAQLRAMNWGMARGITAFLLFW